MKRQDAGEEKKGRRGNSFLQFFMIHGFIKRNYRQPVLCAIAFVMASLLLANTGLSQTVVVNPTSPFTVPAGVTSIKVEVWGGGGGGGGGTGVNIVVNF